MSVNTVTVRGECAKPSLRTVNPHYGEKEIKMATKYLNEVLPPGNVALPFFSSLNDNYKSIVTKIDTKIFGSNT
jgi:hypothetical protein